MRKWILLIVCLAASLPMSGETAPSNSMALPKDPRAILAAAAPFYNFSDPSLKPWHFLASYQLYDDTGKPTETGTFEYWWASPNEYRTTWTRPGATRTDWHTADGKHVFASTGKEPGYFEYALPLALLAPLPNLSEFKSKDYRLERKVVTLSHLKMTCVLDIGREEDRVGIYPEPLVGPPTYCFEPEKPILLISSSGGAVAEFNDIVSMSGEYLARGLIFAFEGHTIMSATIKEITSLSPSDAALKPSATALPVSDELVVMWNLPPIKYGGKLAKKAPPVYPQQAKELGESGTVLLQARIGTGGKIRSEQVVVGVSSLLNDSALKAVSQWVYEPYVANGERVEVETLIKVMFSLGR